MATCWHDVWRCRPPMLTLPPATTSASSRCVIKLMPQAKFWQIRQTCTKHVSKNIRYKMIQTWIILPCFFGSMLSHLRDHKMDLSQLSQPALLHFYCCHRGCADGCPSPFAETFERIALSHSLVLDGLWSRVGLWMICQHSRSFIMVYYMCIYL